MDHKMKLQPTSSIVLDINEKNSINLLPNLPNKMAPLLSNSWLNGASSSKLPIKWYLILKKGIKKIKHYTASPPASAEHWFHLDQDILLVWPYWWFLDGFLLIKLSTWFTALRYWLNIIYGILIFWRLVVVDMITYRIGPCIGTVVEV